MNLSEIVEKLEEVDQSLPVKCILASIGLISNVYVVGQVRPDFPGVILGDREPYLREKVSGDLIQELKTFGDRFQDNDFLLEQTIDIDEKHYEVRYFKLSGVKIDNGALILEATERELVEFREEHEQVETE